MNGKKNVLEIHSSHYLFNYILISKRELIKRIGQNCNF